jgi:glutamate synthase domain-containing protein 3
MRFVAQEVRELMAQLGFRTINEMIGRTDRIAMREALDHWKAHGLDFSGILHQPKVAPSVGRYRQQAQDHGLEKALDVTSLLDLCRPALEGGVPVSATLPIRNSNRAVGTLLGSALTRRWGAPGLPEDTVNLTFHGSAGQSLGAFLPPGITLTVSGDANDGVGKGLSGGKLVIYPPEGARFKAEENVIIGNVALYGATSGEAYVRGIAGERFCVRNSGAHAVVEGVGDHGCEYMTGGRVVVLGATGRNFAAGMSGGIAYVLDESGDFRSRCNQEMVGVGPLEDGEEIELVRSLLFRHARYTQSERAQAVLTSWAAWQPLFVRVMPKDYARVLEAQRTMEAKGLTAEEAEMAAFEVNSRDVARVGGR